MCAGGGGGRGEGSWYHVHVVVDVRCLGVAFALETHRSLASLV